MYLELLKDWCDGLIAHQLSGLNDPHFDGGLICPACKLIHGRCPDAIYPMLYLADVTGDGRYLEAARALFAWQGNMLCDDGSVYNDANSTWNGITVFAAIALCEALERHGHLLESREKTAWEERLRGMGQWLYENIDENTKTNINYIATNTAALSYLGAYFGEAAYLERARRLAQFVLARFTADGLLWGEGKPFDAVTKRGCRPIDIGYNVEESVPSLVKYALCQSDGQALAQLRQVLLDQLAFLLPDGGWDNSMGSRNNKWTYWGSRTSDGCAGGYGLLHQEPAFAEAAHRNLELMRRCTGGGLLHGGPDYIAGGEPPCIHHTFTHANALTAALDAGFAGPASPAALPSDNPERVRYFQELDTWKLANGGMRATVTGYDYNLRAGHASGGTMTLLWHEKAGPVLASSMVDYWLAETLNMQLSRKKARHRPLTPRVELVRDGVRYAQCYDTGASIRVRDEGRRIRVEVGASLVTLEQERPDRDIACALTYRIGENEAVLSGQLRGDFGGCAFLVPVIAKEAAVSTAPACPPPSDIFFLSGGFAAREYVVRPDGDGAFSVTITL